MADANNPPNYTDIRVTCSCGNSFQTRSTLAKDLKVEICSACHPFYTGDQKIITTDSSMLRFKQRYGRLSGTTSSEQAEQQK